MEERQLRGVHRVTMDSRSKATITGVSECVSFDINQIILDTIDGRLTVKGEDMHVTRLAIEKGEADIAGKISSLIYSKPAKKSEESLISRIFS